MKYALFSVPVGTIYDLPQPIKEGETGPVSTIGDEGLYGQACQVRTAPGGVTAAGVHLAPDVAEVVSFYGYHGYVFTRELQFIEEAPLRDYLAEPMVLAGRATDVLNLPKVQGVRMMELERGGLLRRVAEAPEEAEAHKGPSIVICYAPCINHGIKKGMGCVQQEMKDAVASGYWNLYRYSPETHKFTLDSKEPSMALYDFMKGEVRYSSLELSFPENAKVLFAEAEDAAKAKYESYKRRAEDQ